ncbi:MAG TPA: GNAT family N-acetyltransferase [Candidatus Limnocylindrales bacterium]|jgi:GNAT superfamily N-acetyltransferase
MTSMLMAKRRSTFRMPSAGDVIVRRIRRSDRLELERFYEALDPESRRLRFFAMTTGLDDRLSAQFCTPDHDHAEGFVAETLPRDGVERQIVGHLCLEPDRPHAAEVAIAVSERYQGRGLGRRLLDAAVGWARQAGMLRLTATMYATNAPIQHLLRGLGLPFRVESLEPDLTSITIDVDASASIAA